MAGVFVLLSLSVSGASLEELRKQEKDLLKELKVVQAEIGSLQAKAPQKTLNLDLLLTSLNQNGEHYATRVTLDEMNKLSDVLREKTQPVVDGKSLTLHLEVREVKFKKRSGIAKISMVRGDTLPFLDAKSSDRNLSAGLIHTVELSMTEAETLDLRQGDKLTLSGTSRFAGTRDEHRKLPKDKLEVVTIRYFGAPATSGFGSIFLTESEVTVEKTEKNYVPQ